MKLTEIQEALLHLLKNIGMDKTNIITIMLMLKDDEEAMIMLSGTILKRNLTPEEVMQNWVRNYIIAHPQKSKIEKKHANDLERDK